MKRPLGIFFGICITLTLFNFQFFIEIDIDPNLGNNIEIHQEPLILNAHHSTRALTSPRVDTKTPIEIINESAKLRGELISTGGEDCSVWFEWDDDELGEGDCAGLIATGSVCKDGRSIILKNRHALENNQKPRFFSGTNYTYFGVGSSLNMCRMGQNEKGLVVANFDAFGTINNWQFTSDGISGSEDKDLHVPLGNFSTVSAAASWIALHGYHPSQNLIISSEPGVGAIVSVDSNSHSSITWINNTYAGIANAYYCNGEYDVDGNDIRVKEILDDIVNNDTSNNNDNKINWRDVAQRIAKDTNDKEDSTDKFSYASEISRGSSRSTMVSVAGNDSLDSSLFMSWLNFAPTTQVGIFLPLYAGSLKSPSDLPSNFTNDNSGLGIQPYANVKHNYAREGCPPDYYHCTRVREIQKYANYNENLTFNKFESVLNTLDSIIDPMLAKQQLKQFVKINVPKALKGYVENITTYSNLSTKQYPQGTGKFSLNINGLTPGMIYHVRAWASNSQFSSNGSDIIFLTKPNPPTDIQATTIGQNRIDLYWATGVGANNTIIERNSIPTWKFGSGEPIFNGSGNKLEDTGLDSGTKYYYQFWSFTSNLGKHQFSLSYNSGENATHFGNREPIIETEHITHTTENKPYVVLYNYTDLDGDTITWSLKTNASWLTLTGNNLSGVPGDIDPGLYFVNLTCDDNNGSMVYSNFTLHVYPVPDVPVITSRIDDIEFLEDSYFILNLTGKGKDGDGDQIVWQLYRVENELLNISRINSEVFNISGKPNKYGTTRLILWLEDNSIERLSSNQTFLVNVTSVNDRPNKPALNYNINDSDPSIPGLQNLTVEFTATPPLDVDGEINFTYSWDFDSDGDPDYSGLNLINVNYTFTKPGNYSVNVTATDLGGLSNWVSINISVLEPPYPKNVSINDTNGDSEFLLIMSVIVVIAIIIVIVILATIIMKKKKDRPQKE
jgi:hypothetical protein